MMKTSLKLFVVITLFVAAAAWAQKTSYEVRRGTVVTTFADQLVVKMSDGQTRQFTIPEGFQFQVDGRSVGLSELTPGTELTATISTTVTPQVVRTTRIRNGEVIRVAGNNLFVREEGKIRQIEIPSGFKFNLDGREVGVSELRPGTKLTAEIVYRNESTVTNREVGIAGSTPPPPPAPYVAPLAPAPAPAVAEAPAQELPETGSPLPLIALLGSALLAGGAILRRR